MHGGSVQASSDGPGQGSEFVVRLPILDFGFRISDCSDNVQDSSVVDTSANPKSKIQNPKSTRVLVVDDNVDAAQTLAELLDWFGHRTFVAHDGPTALEVARVNQPEVILLDIGLPGMDGYEVARQIRQEPGLSQALLVAVSGYGQEEDRRRSRDVGMDGHMVKPVDLEALQQLLSKAVRSSLSQAGPGPA
jgi:two-component system CheB/CheR fusion protein